MNVKTLTSNDMHHLSLGRCHRIAMQRGRSWCGASILGLMPASDRTGRCFVQQRFDAHHKHNLRHIDISSLAKDQLSREQERTTSEQKKIDVWFMKKCNLNRNMIMFNVPSGTRDS